jgi:hypothetical protein
MDYYYTQLLGKNWREQFKQVGAGGIAGLPSQIGIGMA